MTTTKPRVSDYLAAFTERNGHLPSLYQMRRVVRGRQATLSAERARWCAAQSDPRWVAMLVKRREHSRK